MKRWYSIGIMAIAACVLAPGFVQADSGFYFSSEMGANFAPNMDINGTGYDGASDCDEYINPDYDKFRDPNYVIDPLTPKAPNCAEQGITKWASDMGSANGILAGAAVGYRLRDRYPDSPWGHFRLELEYFYRESEYNQTSPVVATGGAAFAKEDGELQRAEDRVGSLTSHNLFGNLYFDFINDSRFTPYLGFGAGAGFTNMDYGSLWARNSDPAAITTGERWVATTREKIRRNLANTTSSVQTELSDTLFGYQILFGVDYALTESVSLGAKGRWVTFSSFSDTVVWNPLRSHPPNRRLDGSQPVFGRVETDDISLFGFTLNLKYHF